MTKNKSHGFLSELFGEEATQKHTKSSHSHAKAHKATSSNNHAGSPLLKKVSDALQTSSKEESTAAKKPKSKARAEAGRKGGLAPHRCRGRGCSE